MCLEISLATCGGVLITATWTRTECAGSPKTTVLPSFFLPIFLLQGISYQRTLFSPFYAAFTQYPLYRLNQQQSTLDLLL